MLRSREHRCHWCGMRSCRCAARVRAGYPAPWPRNALTEAIYDVDRVEPERAETGASSPSAETG